MRYFIVLIALIGVTSCAKESLEICGTVTGGDYDIVNNMYYLRIDNTRVWVDMKTYDSYYVGDYICVQ